MVRIAVLDDYQDVAAEMGDWKRLPPDARVEVFRDHLVAEDAIVDRLREFEIVVAMRERTPFPDSLLRKLSALKLLVTTGMRNAVIDVDTASDLGVVVSGTGSVPSPTAELTFGLILPGAAAPHSSGGQGYTGGPVAGEHGHRPSREGVWGHRAGEPGVSGGEDWAGVRDGGHRLEPEHDTGAG